MPEQNPVPSSSSQPDDDSMTTANDGMEVKVIKKYSTKRKPIRQNKETLQQRKNGLFRDARDCVISDKFNKKKQLAKKMKPKKKKCLLKESCNCEPCTCYSQDPCDVSLGSLCDSENETSLRKTEAASTRPSSTRSSPLGNREPNDLNLFLKVVGEMDADVKDSKCNKIISANDLDCTEKNDEKSILQNSEVEKKLQEIFCLLKNQRQLSCQNSLDACCSSPFYNRDMCHPCSPLENLVKSFQQLMYPCQCKVDCPERIQSCKSLTRCSCVPCCKSNSVGLCRSACCFKCCSASRRSVNKRQKSKASVNDRELKYKSRMWLLDTNEKLKRKLVKLKRRQEKCCCVCYPTDPEGHFSFLLWQHLMESLVKALIESHPAVKKQDNDCQCRIQPTGFL